MQQNYNLLAIVISGILICFVAIGLKADVFPHPNVWETLVAAGLTATVAIIGLAVTSHLTLRNSRQTALKNIKEDIEKELPGIRDAILFLVPLISRIENSSNGREIVERMRQVGLGSLDYTTFLKEVQTALPNTPTKLQVAIGTHLFFVRKSARQLAKYDVLLMTIDAVDHGADHFSEQTGRVTDLAKACRSDIDSEVRALRKLEDALANESASGDRRLQEIRAENDRIARR